MCLAVPMRVIEIKGSLGTVELGGFKRRISLDLLNKIDIGDYVIVHAGFAIQKLDEEEAEKMLGVRVLAGIPRSDVMLYTAAPETPPEEAGPLEP